MYADDCQLYISFKDNDKQRSEAKITSCLSEIKIWMDLNFLKLNPSKTNLIILNPRSKLPPSFSLNFNFNNALVPPMKTVKSLGVSLSPNMDFSSFISKKVQVCSFHLRNLTHIRKSLPHSARVILVTNLILSTLDYCNSLLIGATNKDIMPLQRVLNRTFRPTYQLYLEYSTKYVCLPINVC